MKRVRSILLVALCLASAVPGLAGTGYGVVVRDWKNSNPVMSTKVGVDGFAKQHVELSITLNLEGQIPLRIGEDEKFAIEAIFLNPGAGSNSVLVRLIPSGVVYGYQDLEGPVAYQRTVSIGDSESADVAFHLTSRGRLRIVPPNTVSEVLLQGPPEGKSLRMTWKDAGNPTNIPSTYAYQVWEKPLFWRPTLMAKGEVKDEPSSLASVVLTQGSASMTSPTKFFENNKNYMLVLSIKRTGPEYRDVYSTPVKLYFRYRTVPTGFGERLVTPLGVLLGGGHSRDLTAVSLFEQL